MTFAGMIAIEYKTGGPSGMNREKSRYQGSGNADPQPSSRAQC